MNRRTELIAGTELDVLIVVPFTREFAAISAEDFITELLVKRIGMKAIIVGTGLFFRTKIVKAISIYCSAGTPAGLRRHPGGLDQRLPP
jgi:riboflavin kinase/FMN adenylyltransferase